MDFESKRKALLKDISSRRRDVMLKHREASVKSKMTQNNDTAKVTSCTQHEKPAVAVYGTQSLFIRSLLMSIQNQCDVKYSEKNEEIIEKCMDCNFSVVILDMDEPTDWRLATDVFTTVKTVKPDQRFLLCTKNKADLNVEVLEKRGALIIKKPVDTNELMDFIRKGNVAHQ
jgi:hypothetical protein